MELVYIAAIGFVQIVALTLVTGYVAARAARQAATLKHEEKAEDWARQDEVAAKVATAAQQAADAAQLLVQAQAETIIRTDEVAKLAAEADSRTQAQLTAIDEQGKKIHILVNSDMTAARTAERDSMKLLVLALRRLGSPADDEELTRIEKRIVDLDHILADRLAAQKRVDEDTRAPNE